MRVLCEMLLLALAVIAVPVMLVIVRLKNYRDLKYWSDFFINYELAANVLGIGRIFYTSVFYNMAGVHLYFFHILEAPFAHFFGPIFYAILPPILLAAGGGFVFATLTQSRVNRSLSALSTFTYTSCPLMFAMGTMPIYGFQYDLYMLAMIPMLCWAILHGKNWVFALAIVAFLAVKEEVVVSGCCLAALAIVYVPTRRRGIILLLCCVGYFFLSRAILASHANETPNSATLIVLAALKGREFELLKRLLSSALLSVDQNMFIKTLSSIYQLSAWPHVIISLPGQIVAFPLACFLALLSDLGFIVSFNHVDVLWKLIYFWATALTLGSLCLGWSLQQVLKKLPALRVVMPMIGLAVLLPGLMKIQENFRATMDEEESYPKGRREAVSEIRAFYEADSAGLPTAVITGTHQWLAIDVPASNPRFSLHKSGPFLIVDDAHHRARGKQEAFAHQLQVMRPVAGNHTVKLLSSAPKIDSTAIRLHPISQGSESAVGSASPQKWTGDVAVQGAYCLVAGYSLLGFSWPSIPQVNVFFNGEYKFNSALVPGEAGIKSEMTLGAIHIPSGPFSIELKPANLEKHKFALHELYLAQQVKEKC